MFVWLSGNSNYISGFHVYMYEYIHVTEYVHMNVVYTQSYVYINVCWMLLGNRLVLGCFVSK